MLISDWSSDVCSSDLAGRAAVGGDRGAVAVVERGARGGADAHVGLEAGQDEVATPELAELFMQRGAGKGVGQPLVDDQFPLVRRHRRVTRPARLAAVEEAAGPALVADVEDRWAGIAGAGAQAGTGDRGDIHP